jgi:cell division septum initiation protein DivIVA
MTREDYLNQMQAFCEEQQENATRNREAFDQLEDEYRQKRQALFEEHEAKKRELKQKKNETQHEVERKMHELKVQWAKEHPIEEVKVVE